MVQKLEDMLRSKLVSQLGCPDNHSSKILREFCSRPLNASCHESSRYRKHPSDTIQRAIVSDVGRGVLCISRFYTRKAKTLVRPRLWTRSRVGRALTEGYTHESRKVRGRVCRVAVIHRGLSTQGHFGLRLEFPRTLASCGIFAERSRWFRGIHPD